MSKRRCALARRGARAVRTHKVWVVEPQPPSLVEPELLEPLLLVRLGSEERRHREGAEGAASAPDLRA